MLITLSEGKWYEVLDVHAPVGSLPSAVLGSELIIPLVGDTIGYSFDNRKDMDKSLAQYGLKIGKDWGAIEHINPQ